jgi:hypothetical protein
MIVDMIGACASTFSRFMSSHDFHAVCSQVLKPADMDEYNRTTCLQNTKLHKRYERHYGVDSR